MINVPYQVSISGKRSLRRASGYWCCSDEDVDLLQREWRLDRGYPRESGVGGKRASRLIAERMLGQPLLADEEVHHLDENPLNNQRENLEVKTRLDHRRHQHAYRQNGLPSGVTRHGRGYQARRKKDGKDVYLGTYDTLEEASAAYQKALTEE